MTESSNKSDKNLLSDLEQNLEDNLYSKSNQEEEFYPPNLSPEEFQKLWNEKKFDAVDDKKHPTYMDHEEAHKTESEHSQTSCIDELTIDQSKLIKILQQSINEINSNKQNELSEHTRRGSIENSKEPVVRVIRIPLSKHMEDQLITIRRLLNKHNQANKPREVIDDYQVLLALLHWASKQLNEDIPNPQEVERPSPQNKQLGES